VVAGLLVGPAGVFLLLFDTAEFGGVEAGADGLVHVLYLGMIEFYRA
jgi:hypothetical protein